MLVGDGSIWRRFQRCIIRKDILFAICVATAVICVGTVFAWENNKVVSTNVVTSAHYLLEPGNHLSFLANWDGRDYIDIAINGYQSQIQTSFFPLYPLLIHLLNYLVRSPLMSALLISWSAFVGSIYFYLKVVKLIYGIRDGVRAFEAVIFFVLFPTGVFLLAAYTESLFAFFSLATIYFALQRQTIRAGIAMALATATHDNSIFMIVFIGLLLWEERVRLREIITTTAIGCLGLVSYMLYLQYRFKNPLQFIAAQKTHGWLGYNAPLISELHGRDAVFLLLAIAATWYWWHRRKSFAIYSALYVCIVFLGNLGGYGRYVLMDFPIQLMLYETFRNKKLGYALVLAACMSFWMYFLLQFAGGYTGG